MRDQPSLLGDRREAIGEVGAATAPELDALALLADESAEPIVLDLVQPARSRWRPIGEGGLARSNETGCRVASPQGRQGAPPRCGLHLRCR